MGRAILVLGVTLLAACGGGAPDRVEIVAVRCGLVDVPCDLGRAIAAGGAVDVEVRGPGGEPLDGLDLAIEPGTTDAGALAVPAVDVVPIAPIDGGPAWRLHGFAPGFADVVAIDAGGAEAGRVEVQTVIADTIRFETDDPAVTGPLVEYGFGEGWQIPADQPATLQAVARLDEYDVLGQLHYTITADPGGLLGHQLPDGDAGAGILRLQAPAGDYPLTIVADAPRSPGGRVAIHAVTQ
jgi:hypothetical protein